MNTVIIYGIKNCQTMKKAMTWLETHQVEYEFHDYKKQSIDKPTLESWLSQKPWDEVINKRGTTWRKLSDEDKSDIDTSKAISLMLANTSLIKRPALVIDNVVHLGFDEAHYTTLFTN